MTTTRKFQLLVVAAAPAVVLLSISELYVQHKHPMSFYLDTIDTTTKQARRTKINFHLND